MVPETATQPPPASRPMDILDSAAFLTPDILGDDFRDPAATDTARGLSAESFMPLNVPETPIVAPLWPEPELAIPADEPEAASPISFETAPAWQDDTPISAEPVASFAPSEPAPNTLEAVTVSDTSPAPAVVDGEDDASLLGLLDRLEAALARRVTEAAPPAPTSLAALREILNQSQSMGASPRAAGRNW
jgi:hypothetical protein